MSHEKNKEELVSTFYQKGYIILGRSLETSNVANPFLMWLEYATSHFAFWKQKFIGVHLFERKTALEADFWAHQKSCLYTKCVTCRTERMII